MDCREATTGPQEDLDLSPKEARRICTCISSGRGQSMPASLLNISSKLYSFEEKEMIALLVVEHFILKPMTFEKRVN